MTITADFQQQPVETRGSRPENTKQGMLLKGFMAGQPVGLVQSTLQFLLEQFWAKAGTSSAVPEAEPFSESH